MVPVFLREIDSYLALDSTDRAKANTAVLRLLSAGRMAMLGLIELKILVKRAFDRGFIDRQWLGFQDFQHDVEWAARHPTCHEVWKATNTRYSATRSRDYPAGMALATRVVPSASGGCKRSKLKLPRRNRTTIRSEGLPHAIIRGKNGRRHEVDLGNAPVRVEISPSEETVEIFIEGDFETLPEECRRFSILNMPRRLFSEATATAARCAAKSRAASSMAEKSRHPANS
jgi:hypothetical protein